MKRDFKKDIIIIWINYKLIKWWIWRRTGSQFPGVYVYKNAWWCLRKQNINKFGIFYSSFDIPLTENVVNCIA